MHTLKVWLILLLGNPKNYSSLPNHNRRAVAFQECHPGFCWASCVTSPLCLSPRFMQKHQLAPRSGRIARLLSSKASSGQASRNWASCCTTPSCGIGQYLPTNYVFQVNTKMVFTDKCQCSVYLRAIFLDRLHKHFQSSVSSAPRGSETKWWSPTCCMALSLQALPCIWQAPSSERDFHTSGLDL